MPTKPPDASPGSDATPEYPLRSHLTLGEMNTYRNVHPGQLPFRPDMPEARPPLIPPAPLPRLAFPPRGLTALCSCPGVTSGRGYTKTRRTDSRLTKRLNRTP
jgi:hypothetical protein